MCAANELARDPDIPSPVVTHVGRVSTIVTPATGPSPAGNTGADHAAQMVNGIMRGLPASATATSLLGNGTAPGHAPANAPVQLLPNNGAVSGLPAAGLHGNTTIPGLPGNGVFPRPIPGNHRQTYGIPGAYPQSSIPLVNFPTAPLYSGPLRFLLASDVRAEVFADSFLFWLDTVEMVRVAGHTPVYFSGWALPVYLFCFLSSMRLVLTPHSPLLSPLGVVLQDLPFLVLRTALIALFGFVTPLLYVMKNLLVCLAYIYFNFMTKLKVFNTERMF